MNKDLVQKVNEEKIVKNTKIITGIPEMYLNND